MCVDERCTIVTSASCSHSAPQMSKAELLLPMTTTFLPAYASGPGCAEEWCWSPRKTSWPGQLRDVRLAGHAGGEDQVRGAQRQRLPVALDLDRPLARLGVGVRRRSWPSVLDQYGTSITLTYDSSQSPILSLGANTGQLSGNFRYGRWSYQTGSCRHSDL